MDLLEIMLKKLLTLNLVYLLYAFSKSQDSFLFIHAGNTCFFFVSTLTLMFLDMNLISSWTYCRCKIVLLNTPFIVNIKLNKNETNEC